MHISIKAALVGALLSLSATALAADANVRGRVDADLDDVRVQINIGKDGKPRHGRHDRHDDHGHHGYAGEHARIPAGHLPPPGQCRIWYYDREPGQQPPPGDCNKLRRHVPHGASLIRG